MIAVPYNVYFVFKLWRKGPEYKAASLRSVTKMVVGQKVSKAFTGKDLAIVGKAERALKVKFREAVSCLVFISPFHA